MRAFATVAGVLLFASFVCLGQLTDSKVMFEVASVKPAPPDDGHGMTRVQGGLGSPDPGQVTYRNISLRNLLGRGYPESYRINGPGWLDVERYDVIARIPPNTTKEQFKIMIQNLLAERFGVSVHHETKEFPAYNLVVARGGPKLKKAIIDDLAAPPSGARDVGKVDQQGFPQLDRPGLITTHTIGPSGVPVARLTAKAQAISALVSTLSGTLNEPVYDKTGLTGKYDFNLEYAPGGAMALAPPSSTGNVSETDPGAASIAYVIKNLGLTLERTKATLDVLVVDHAEKVPTEN